MKLVFATNNPKKIEEAKLVLPATFELVSLSDIGFHREIVEDADTFEGNAEIKATTIFNEMGMPCFADDSGLVVPSLGGLPGVKSARYASESGPVNHTANNEKLLDALKGASSREAYFITVLCYIDEHGAKSFFEGRVEGRIAEAPEGLHGFGYDPIFIPNAYDASFGVLGPEVKKIISHRSRAINALAAFLHTSS